MLKVFLARIFIVFGLLLLLPAYLQAEDKPQKPVVYINGKAGDLTIQDLDGVATRPLRKLVQKNNKLRKDELIQVYAIGTRDGDALSVQFGALAPGMRVTLFKLMREPNKPRFFTVPLSIFQSSNNPVVYHEKVLPYKAEYLIFAFEKTDDAGKKSPNLTYFEEKPRDLIVKTMKPNLKLTSIRLKMKDAASNESTFSYDAQELINRFVNLQRIFVIRLWRDEREPTQDSL